ncbi:MULTISPECIES: NUDIX hydrolase [Prosthecochloris]|nr:MULTISPECIES: NUDIX hydrolase [Prosthecochloris]
MPWTQECETDMQLPDDPGTWEVLESTYLYREPWLTMRRDAVRLPNGRTIPDFFIWEYPAWVNVVALTGNGEMVLIRQYRHGAAKVSYELPAGVHDNPTETLLDAARRELLEETGFGGGEWRELMRLSANPALQTNITHTFLAEGVEEVGSQHLDSTEEISVHLLRPDKVKTIIDEGEMLQALHAAPILKYLMENL